MMYINICDAIKQNESELANIDWKIQLNKADNIFVFYCFATIQNVISQEPIAQSHRSFHQIKA